MLSGNSSLLVNGKLYVPLWPWEQLKIKIYQLTLKKKMIWSEPGSCAPWYCGITYNMHATSNSFCISCYVCCHFVGISQGLFCGNTTMKPGSWWVAWRSLIEVLMSSSTSTHLPVFNVSSLNFVGVKLKLNSAGLPPSTFKNHLIALFLAISCTFQQILKRCPRHELSRWLWKESGP